MSDNSESVMRLIKLRDVMDATGLEYMSNGDFPKPVSLGRKSVAWVDC